MLNFTDTSLPDDIIITNILTRLPVKTLLRFKLVSKLWYFTIQKDRNFSELHLSRSTHRQYLISFSCVTYIRSSHLQHAVAVQHTGQYASFIGLPLLKINSCLDGLVVYYTCFAGGSVYVCNPSTKQTITLPQLTRPNGLPGCDPVITRYYEIGYDRVTKMYKVLYICRVEEYLKCYHECSIITIGKDNGWRKMSDHPPYLLNHMYKAYSNGAIHWRNTNPHLVSEVPAKEVIVAFDFTTEKFRVIPIPDYIARGKTNQSLGALKLLGAMAGGHLALYDSLQRTKNNTVSIWLLQDYVNQVWINKTFEFPLDDEVCEPIGTLPSGEIIMKPGRDARQCWLYYYDLEKNTSRRVEFTNLPSQEYCQGYRSGGQVNIYHFVENLYSWKI